MTIDYEAMFDKEYERLVFANKAPDPILEANKNGKRVAYGRYSQTLRQAPQNYCLAVLRDGRFVPAPDKASTINAHSLGIVLRQFYEQSTDHSGGGGCGVRPQGILGTMIMADEYHARGPPIWGSRPSGSAGVVPVVCLSLPVPSQKPI